MEKTEIRDKYTEILIREAASSALTMNLRVFIARWNAERSFDPEVAQFGARLGSRIFFKFLLLLSDFIFGDSIAASF